jgi:hypothetical protein
MNSGHNVMLPATQVISYACDVAGLLLVDLLVHASCQRGCQLGLGQHPPAGDPGTRTTRRCADMYRKVSEKDLNTDSG